MTLQLNIHTTGLLFVLFSMFSGRCITVRSKSLSVDGWYPATPGRSRSRRNFTDSSSDSDSRQSSRLRPTPTPAWTPTPQPWCASLYQFYYLQQINIWIRISIRSSNHAATSWPLGTEWLMWSLHGRWLVVAVLTMQKWKMVTQFPYFVALANQLKVSNPGFSSMGDPRSTSSR